MQEETIEASEEEDEDIKSDKLSNESFVTGVVALEYVYKWKNGEFDGETLNKYMQAISRKYDDIEPGNDSEKTINNLVAILFESIGTDAITAESDAVSELASKMARDSVDDHVDTIVEYLYKEKYIDLVKEEAEKTGTFMSMLP